MGNRPQKPERFSFSPRHLVFFFFSVLFLGCGREEAALGLGATSTFLESSTCARSVGRDSGSGGRSPRTTLVTLFFFSLFSLVLSRDLASSRVRRRLVAPRPTLGLGAVPLQSYQYPCTRDILFCRIICTANGLGLPTWSQLSSSLGRSPTSRVRRCDDSLSGVQAIGASESASHGLGSEVRWGEPVSCSFGASRSRFGDNAEAGRWHANLLPAGEDDNFISALFSTPRKVEFLPQRDFPSPRMPRTAFD